MATPRKNPFTKIEGQKKDAPEDGSKKLAGSIGKPDQGSGPKAKKASEIANNEVVINNGESWPMNENGTPLFKAEMSAAELVPTGQYANVTIGPVRLHFLIDPDRKLEEGEHYFDRQARETITAALNEAADIIEGDVVAVQRNLVMENIQNNNEG